MANIVERIPVAPVPEVCVTKDGKVGVFMGGAYRLLDERNAWALIHRLTDACRNIERRKAKK